MPGDDRSRWDSPCSSRSRRSRAPTVSERGSEGPATKGSCLSFRDFVNSAMSSDDRIDNKRILVSSPVIVVSRTGKEVLSMSFLSPRVQLALVAVVSAAAGRRLRQLPLGPVGASRRRRRSRPRSACAVTLFPMVHRAAARISLRSRERKLRLFLDLFQPGPRDDGRRRRRDRRAVRGRLERQLLRGALPVARADHRRRPHRARPLRRRVPDRDGRARRRARASLRRRRVRPRLLERRRSSTSPAGATGSGSSSRSSAASPGRSS